MRAVMYIPGPEGARAELHDIPTPVPGEGEVLVRVRAASINRGEILVRKALKSGKPQQNGIEFAGEVVGLGLGVGDIAMGTRVMGHWRAGQAEYVAVPRRLVIPAPERLSWAEAAAWPNVFITAHDAIVVNAGLRRGESILVNAASSGIGVAALQIARLIGATPVIGSSRVVAKLAALGEFGMDVGLDVSSGAFADAALKATAGKGVDVVIDSVGADVLEESIRCMAIGGRLVGVGRLGASRGDIDMDLLALRRLRLIGVTFRTRTLAERIACVEKCAADLLPALREGRLKPVIDRTFPMADIAAAHDHMERNQHIGKIVLTMA